MFQRQRLLCAEAIRDTLAHRLKLEFTLKDGGSAQGIKISEEKKGQK